MWYTFKIVIILEVQYEKYLQDKVTSINPTAEINDINE